MRKFVSLFVIMLTLNITTYANSTQLDLIGQGAILIHGETGQVLYEKNANEKLFPASTTKILTAIIAIEEGNLDDRVVVDENSVRLTDGSHIALEPGEILSLEELLYALLIQSANDAANVIGTHIAGDLNSFVELMNKKAKDLGANNSNFVNPSGLHDENHYTTAYDLALISKYAMENQVFRDFVKEYIYTLEPTNKKSEARYFKSNNRMIYSSIKMDLDGETIPIKYQGATGIKTGYTSISRNCLVSSASRDGVELISVVLKSEGNSVFADSHKLLNYGFDNFTYLKLGQAGKYIESLDVENGLDRKVPVIIADEFSYIVSEKDKDRIEEKYSFKEDLVAPISEGDVLGQVDYFLNGELIHKSSLVAGHGVEANPKNNKLSRLLSKWYWFVFGFLGIVRYLNLRKKKRLRRLRKERLKKLSEN